MQHAYLQSLLGITTRREKINIKKNNTKTLANLLHKVKPYSVTMTDVTAEELMCQQNVFALVSIELSKHLTVHLPEQQNFIVYQIKQEEFGKKLKREDRESKVNVLQCSDAQWRKQ